MKLFVQKASGIISHFVRSYFVRIQKYNIIKIPFVLLYEIVFRDFYSGFRNYVIKYSLEKQKNTCFTTAPRRSLLLKQSRVCVSIQLIHGLP